MDIDFDDLSGGSEQLAAPEKATTIVETEVRRPADQIAPLSLRKPVGKPPEESSYVLPIPTKDGEPIIVGLEDVTGEQFYCWLLDIYPSESVKREYNPAYFDANGDWKVASARKRQVVHAIADYFKRVMTYTLEAQKEPVEFDKIIN